MTAPSPGDVILAPHFQAGWGMDVASVTGTPSPSGTSATVAGLTITKTVGSISEEYRVDVVLTGVATAGTSRLQGNLYADGVLQPGTIFLGNNSNAQVAGNIESGSMTYKVTGLAAGSRVFEVKASQTGSAWTLAASTCRITVQRVR